MGWYHHEVYEVRIFSRVMRTRPFAEAELVYAQNRVPMAGPGLPPLIRPPQWHLGIWNWESAREPLAGEGGSLWPDCWHERIGYAEHLLSSWESETFCAYMTGHENSGCWASNGPPRAETLLEVVAFSWLEKEKALREPHGTERAWRSLHVGLFATQLCTFLHHHDTPELSLQRHAESCSPSSKRLHLGWGVLKAPNTVWNRICLGEAPPYASD